MGLRPSKIEGWGGVEVGLPTLFYISTQDVYKRQRIRCPKGELPYLIIDEKNSCAHRKNMIEYKTRLLIVLAICRS